MYDPPIARIRDCRSRHHVHPADNSVRQVLFAEAVQWLSGIANSGRPSTTRCYGNPLGRIARRKLNKRTSLDAPSPAVLLRFRRRRISRAPPPFPRNAARRMIKSINEHRNGIETCAGRNNVLSHLPDKVTFSKVTFKIPRSCLSSSDGTPEAFCHQKRDRA